MLSSPTISTVGGAGGTGAGSPVLNCPLEPPRCSVTRTLRSGQDAFDDVSGAQRFGQVPKVGVQASFGHPVTIHAAHLLARVQVEQQHVAPDRVTWPDQAPL